MNEKISSEQTKKQITAQATTSSNRASKYSKLLNGTNATNATHVNQRKESINELALKDATIDDLHRKLLLHQSPVTVIIKSSNNHQ